MRDRQVIGRRQARSSAAMRWNAVMGTAYRTGAPRRASPRLRAVRVAGHAEAPRAVDGHRDPDPGPAIGPAGGGAPSSTIVTPRSARDQVGAVERAVDAQGLARLGRAVGQVDRAPSRGRAAAIASMPRSGARARISTAPAVPSAEVTALAHQCMP